MKLRYKEHEYPMPDLDALSFREAGIMNRITQVEGALDWGTAFEKGNPLVLAGALLVALRRAGVRYDEDDILDSPAFTTITVVSEPGDEADLPEAPAPLSERPELGGGESDALSGSGPEEPGTPAS